MSDSRRPVYRPTWWEKRFPWLLDVLAGMDPEPLGEALGRLLEPARTVVDAATIPLAEVLDRVEVATRALWASASEALGRAVPRLPMPSLVRDALWLRPDGQPRADGVPAQEALRRQYRVALPSAFLTAVVIHVLAFAFWPPLTLRELTVAGEALEAVNLPPAVEIPPPPPDLPRPAVPVVAPADISEDITIGPTTFADNPVTTLPAPPPDPADTLQDRGTAFAPYTVAPRLLNPDEVAELVRRAYPPALRNAGIGGRAVVELHVGEDGRVQTVRLARSAGHPQLDEAALRVADHLRFAPGLNVDTHVAVWVRIALEFQVRSVP